MAIDYKDLGVRIKQKREECKMSQADLAARVQLSTQHMSNVENAKSKIGLEKLVEVANVLKCSVDELLCGSIKAGKSVYISEIAEQLEDFSDEEIRVLPEFLKNLNYMYMLLEESINKDAD